MKKEHKFFITSLFLVVLFSATSLQADVANKKWLNWQDTSIAGLYGGGFKVDPSDQGTITIEHASDWSFGDMFVFLDNTKFSNDAINSLGDSWAWYGEATVRLSISKLTNTNINFSILKDILFATNYEHGSDRDSTESLLLGVGFDMDLSALSFIGLDNLKYFQLNLYKRNDLHSNNSGFKNYQITAVTALPFQIGKVKFLADGYLDYVFSSGPQDENFHLNPQIKMDLGNFYGEPDKLFVGTELDYWSNKYGIKDSSTFATNQFAASFLVKYHF